MKRKTPFQLQALQEFYAEEQYPDHGEMEDIARVLELTYKQVRGWFIEKRRRDKVQIRSMALEGRIGKMVGKKDALVGGKIESFSGMSLKYRPRVEGGRKRSFALVWDLLSPDYILGKIFRKDGPSLGVEFDPLPLKMFRGSKDIGNSSPPLQDNQKRNKRKKVSKDSIIDSHDESQNGPVKKHGIGKGLMRAWQVTNPNGGDYPTGVNFSGRRNDDVAQLSIPVSQTPQLGNKKRKQSVSITRKLANKVRDMKKHFIKRLEVESLRPEIQKQPLREKCQLSLEGVISQEFLNQISLLMDDEELELRELQAGPNPPTCSEHCSAKEQFGCSLCKDLLPKFPPNSIRMKQPFATQPWDSSPEIVKKLFKVFHFLYTYSVPLGVCHFTLDEFAQAFHDKESLLLGKVHLELLKLLLSDVECEINNGVSPLSGVSCNFLALLHSVEDHDFVLEFWKKSLNPLTWTEILRQVLVAAGFESNHSALRREAFSKERRIMAKYGLHPRTLKGELFRLLTELGIKGSKISDLAKSSQIAELYLASTTEELENLIGSTLSSDITLFEKISSSSYRIRCNALAKEDSDLHSDSEDSGSVHDILNESTSCSSSDPECESESSDCKKLKLAHRCNSRNNLDPVANEIDESHVGEKWLLGLMEGEYSDLSIEEKLSALAALIGLLSAGSSIRMEDRRHLVGSVFNPPHCSSGAKIKRSMPKQFSLPRPSWVHLGQLREAKETYISSKFYPIDSSMLNIQLNAKNFCKDKDAKAAEQGISVHPMQSIFLGSDRRYNRYWLFLGPCDAFDPGHKMVYFESSEDGHWEVIDTEEALRALLSILDDRGTREAFLIESLEKREAFLCREMSTRMAQETEITHTIQSEQSELDRVREDSSSPISDIDNNLSTTRIMEDPSPQCGAVVLEAGRKSEEEYRRWNRLQDFDAWIWNYFYCHLNAVKHSRRSYLESLARCLSCHDLYWKDEKHCKFCHKTFELDFDLEERYAIHSATCRDEGWGKAFPKHKVLPSQLQVLKAAVYAIESAMPEDALVGAWRKCAHRLWVKRLRRTSSVQELLQVVTVFVDAINEDWLYQRNSDRGSNNFMDELIACFPSMPQTSSALAVWLVKLDELLSPCSQKLLC